MLPSTKQMEEILVLAEVVKGITGGQSLDQLDSLNHVKIVGLVNQIYRHPDMAAHIGFLHDTRRLVEKDREQMEE